MYVELIPEEVATSKRYKKFSGYSIQEVVDQVKTDFGAVDYVVHSLANGPEVTKPLLETSRAGEFVCLFTFQYLIGFVLLDSSRLLLRVYIP